MRADLDIPSLLSKSFSKLLLNLKGPCKIVTDDILGPAVQSMVSLMSLLITNSLTAVAKLFSNTLKFFCKNVSSFCNAKATHIFSAKNINVFAIFQGRNFNIMLANNFVKF